MAFLTLLCGGAGLILYILKTTPIMKSATLLSFIACLFLFPASVDAAVIVKPDKAEGKELSERKAAGEEAMSKRELRRHKRELRREKRQERRAARQELRKMAREMKEAGYSDRFILLVILGILLPPLAMFFYDGLSDRFWISLVLTLLFFLPGVIYTLIVLFSEN